MSGCGKLGNVHLIAILATALLASGSWPTGAAENDPPPEFSWNVFLDHWKVIGPFPRTDRYSGCLDVDFLSGEPEVQFDKPVTWKDVEYRWKDWSEPVADIRRALGIEGDAGDYHVAYASTQFTSPEEMPAVLAIGHDDGTRVWLNGKEVHRHDIGTSAFLDQARLDVTLRQGTNSLLMKVTQRWGAWTALARLLPPGEDKPLVSVALAGQPGTSTLRLPTLSFDLLDAGGNVLRSMRASGYRTAEPPRILFTAYGERSDPEPAKVRIRFQHPGVPPCDQVVDWSAVHGSSHELAVEPGEPLTGRVVDAATGQPVTDAQIRVADTVVAARSDSEGRFSIARYNPFATNLAAAAAGYLPNEVSIATDSRDPIAVKLSPGGHVLRGTVTDPDGKPIAGARVDIRQDRAWLSAVTTDGEGRFEFIGLSGETSQLYPTVVHPDYVAKDTFGLPLDDDKVTEVQWTLAKAAVVTGRVTAKADGSPLEGVRVQAGHDRFASNRVVPEAITDADGRFRLGGVPSGETLIHAFSDQFAPSMQRAVTAVATPTEISFQLEPGQPVTGRIVDPQGSPIDDVWLVTDTWDGVRMFRRETRSDKDGRFTLAHMPATPAEVHVLKRDYVSKRDLMAVGGEHYDITLKPVVRHSVHLRLSDSDKPPAKVEVFEGYQPPGNDRVSWNRRSYRDRDYKGDTGIFTIQTDEPSTAKRSLRFRVEGYRDVEVAIPDDAAEPQSFELTLEKLGTTSGRVVLADDATPMEGVTVALVNKTDRLRLDHYVQYQAGFQSIVEFTGVRAVTDAAGAFQLPAADASPEDDLLLIKKGAGFHYIPGARAVLAAQPVELPFPRHGSLEGTVLVAGKPSPNESVHIGWIPSPSSGSDWDFPFGIGGIVPVDGEGRFCFEGLGPGRYRLARVREFNSPGGGGMSCYLVSEEVTLLPGEKLVHDIVQPAGHTVTGRTVDLEGRPLEGCIVSVTRRSPSYERLDAVRSDAEGRFTIVHLPAGEFEFSADHYTRQTGAACGLGNEDFRGRTTANVGEGTEITIKLAPATAGGLASIEASLTGTIPPDFTAKLLGSDKTFSLSDQWGKVVAIDFWATWCGPCMAVMPEMKKIYEEYKDRDDVVFITVSLDHEEESLRRVIEEQQLGFPVIFSGQGWEESAAKAFGVTSIPSSFVIGRDGRFAAEKMHGSQLASAIKTALEKPLDPALVNARPARLTVKVGLDEEGIGLPGVKLHLTAVAADGKTVADEELPVPGQAAQIVWLYPAMPSGGTVTVTARAEHLEEKSQKLENPEPAATVSILFASPRQLTGRIAADDQKTPAPGLKVTAYGDSGFRRSATTDEDGRFSIPALPGSYRIQVEGNEHFAPISTEALTAEVSSTADAEPLQIAACHAIKLTGAVRDAEGAAVAGADVTASGHREPVKTDDAGRFTLAGVPSLGEVMLYARKENLAGKLPLDNPDPNQPVEIQLGQSSGAPNHLAPGDNVPPLKVASLTSGEQHDWKPAEGKNTLVVFCALWHPTARDFLNQARQWADKADTHLAAVSTDWHPRQAQRYVAQHSEGPEILFAGPGGLAVAAEWKFAPPAQAFLVSPKGKVISCPGPGGLP